MGRFYISFCSVICVFYSRFVFHNTDQRNSFGSNRFQKSHAAREMHYQPSYSHSQHCRPIISQSNLPCAYSLRVRQTASQPRKLGWLRSPPISALNRIPALARAERVFSIRSLWRAFLRVLCSCSVC